MKKASGRARAHTRARAMPPLSLSTRGPPHSGAPAARRPPPSLPRSPFPAACRLHERRSGGGRPAPAGSRPQSPACQLSLQGGCAGALYAPGDGRRVATAAGGWPMGTTWWRAGAAARRPRRAAEGSACRPWCPRWEGGGGTTQPLAVGEGDARKKKREEWGPDERPTTAPGRTPSTAHTPYTHVHPPRTTLPHTIPQVTHYHELPTVHRPTAAARSPPLPLKTRCTAPFLRPIQDPPLKGSP